MNKELVEQTKKEINLANDLGLALAKAEGNLNHLARESSDPEWQGTLTQGMAILDALDAVQKARKAHQQIINKILF